MPRIKWLHCELIYNERHKDALINAGLESGVLKNLGIKGRVLLLTLLPVTLMAVVLGSYFTWLQQSELESQLLQRGEMIAEQLAPLVAPANVSPASPLTSKTCAP